MSAVVDKKYYQVVPAGSLAKHVLSRARDRIYDDFIATTQPKPTDEILDVGVSDVVSDDANVVERKYPYPKKITACGLGDAVDFKASYPKIRYVRIPPNQRLPFEDAAFEVATSNAVLEHVAAGTINPCLSANCAVSRVASLSACLTAIFQSNITPLCHSCITVKASSPRRAAPLARTNGQIPPISS